MNLVFHRKSLIVSWCTGTSLNTACVPMMVFIGFGLVAGCRAEIVQLTLNWSFVHPPDGLCGNPAGTYSAEALAALSARVSAADIGRAGTWWASGTAAPPA